MIRIIVCALILVLGVAGSSRAQAPTGAIVGVVADATGAAIVGEHVSIAHSQTDQSRTVVTSAVGHYVAELLPPGRYRLTIAVAGFKRLERDATVDAGTATSIDLTLEIGDVSQTVTVGAAVPLLQSDHHQVAGLVHREQIDNLPLNGRNFLELAKLHPGVTEPARLGDNRVFVSALGSGLQTVPRVGYSRVTVDGASINTPGTAGVLLQVSQDVAQEFQIATASFDQATGLTSNGAINIVTRSGGNQYHGSAFAHYRDHRLSAYPALRRESANPDPFFQRAQFGFDAGGPLRTDRVFVFGNYERHDQRAVGSVQPATLEFAPLGGIFASPYLGNQLSLRVDARLNANHNAFARYTYDGNRLFGPGTALPSAWFRRTNRVGQSVAALTSVLSPQVVNDLRFSYFHFTTLQRPAAADDCSGCFGLNATPINILDVGVSFGRADAMSFGGRRFELTDSLVWHTGNHRVRVGFDWERITNTGSNDSQDARITLWSPQRVRLQAPTIPLPAAFTTVDQILQLPAYSVEIRVGPGENLWRDFENHRVADLFRAYIGDTWRIGRRLTLNAGLASSYEPNALNHDLTKPLLLAPLLGADNLDAPATQLGAFSPTVGFAWTATGDGKTVVRGGAGRYFDPAVSTNYNNLIMERFALSPLGTERVTVQGSAISCQGLTLDFTQRPTSVTGARLLEMLPGCLAELTRSRNPDNRDFTYRNLDLTKSGQNMYDPSYRLPQSVHLTLGVQRELSSNTVLSADFVWKRFAHTFINGIDYNRWFSAAGPVIPKCTDDQKADLAAPCSNGAISFDTTIGRDRYAGLLVRAERRFSGRAQLLASYALGSYVGTNGTGTATSESAGGRVFGFNNDDWFENYGPLPTDRRHTLNVSGFFTMPWRLQAAFGLTAYSPTPMSPYVSAVDFNGDGTRNDLLPGTTVNQFGRTLGKDDLARLVERYNQEFAGKRTLGGQDAPTLTLPQSYSFEDSFFTQDLRIARQFEFAHPRARLLLFADVFNLFNNANHAQASSNLFETSSFGQPSLRSSEVFGSGGPRAVQFGAKLAF